MMKSDQRSAYEPCDFDILSSDLDSMSGKPENVQHSTSNFEHLMMETLERWTFDVER